MHEVEIAQDTPPQSEEVAEGSRRLQTHSPPTTLVAVWCRTGPGTQ